MNGRLGRLPAKHDPKALRLARYLTPQLLAAPPKRVDWLAQVTDLGMMKNDELGCCTISAAGHMIQAWTAANGSQVIIPDDEIVAAYSAVGGYVPGDPSTDQGAYALDVLKYWRDVGIGGHKIRGWVSVNPLDRLHMEIAANLFGGIYAGFDLPLSARNQEAWAVPGGGPVGEGTPRSWGGHMIPLLNDGPLGHVCVTWGAPKTITWQFDGAYCEEAYALVAEDWAPPGRAAPSGLLIDDLMADLAQVAA